MPPPPLPPPAGDPRLPMGLSSAHPFHLGLAGAGFFQTCSRAWHEGRFGKRRIQSRCSEGRGPSGPRAVGGHRNGNGGGVSRGFNFPVKAAATAGSLALTGDLLAQIIETSVWKTKKTRNGDEASKGRKEGEAESGSTTDEGPWRPGYDVLRALRMTSYGFLCYGPILDKWFFTLDSFIPGPPTVRTLATKVLATQTMLNPCLLLLVFAYHYTLMGRVGELPQKYSRDLVPTMLNGFKFWLPASVVNFAVVPLPARVLFMSSCSIIWNTYLSMTVTK